MPRKWEKKYQEYNSEEMKKKFDELKKKVDDKQASQEELREYNKMKRIYGYLPQVENLKEAIDVLGQRLQLLKDEEASRAELAKIEKLEAEIEEQRQQYMNDDEQNFDKLVELQDKQIKLNDMRLSAEKKSRDPEISQMSAEELKNEILVTKGQISKCHLAARCFMEGYSRESIDLKVNKEWKNKRFTSKEPLTPKKDTSKEGSKVSDKDEPAVDLQKTTVIKKGMIPAAESVRSGETALSDINGIREKIMKAHPWLRRFSKLPFGLGKRAESKLAEYVEQETERLEKLDEALTGEKGDTEAKTEMTQTEEFRAKYAVANYDVMDIAEKGISGIEAEKAAERKASARERYEAMKQRAQDTGRYQIDENGVKHDTFEKDSDEER